MKVKTIILILVVTIVLILLLCNVYDFSKVFWRQEDGKVEYSNVYDTTDYVNVHIYNSEEEFLKKEKSVGTGVVINFKENIDSCSFLGDSMLVINSKLKTANLFLRNQLIDSFIVSEYLTETPMFNDSGEEMFQYLVEKIIDVYREK